MVTLFFASTSSNEVLLVEIAIAFVLLYIPWHTYLNWQRVGREGLPVFSMVALMFWIFYAMPVFWGDRIVSDLYSAVGRELPESLIIEAEFMALLGVFSMWLGFKIHLPKIIPDGSIELRSGNNCWNYLRCVLFVGSLITLAESSAGLLGDGGRQILTLLVTAVPTVVFAVFLRRFIRKEAILIDKVLLAVFLIIRFMAGLSSGMLGSFGFIIIISVAVFISERRRLPVLALFAVVAFVLFFQPAKSDFRGMYWKEDVSASMMDRTSFWVNRSIDKWKDAFNDETGKGRTEVLNQSLSRVSLLTASANVIDQTPEVVPYQNGRLYSFLLVTFVPRFVWPDKPSANEANQFYQLAYGISDEEQLSTVSIAIGVLVEGFINFGWPGAAGIMFLLGIVLRSYQTNFFGSDAGVLIKGIGFVLLPGFLAIEVQLAGYIGGIVQQVLFILVVMLPVIRIRSSSRITSRPIPPSIGVPRSGDTSLLTG